MGTNINDYLVYGRKVLWDNEFMDAYEKNWDDHIINVIADGMSGEYIVIGPIIWESYNHRWDGDSNTSFSDIDVFNLPKLEAEYKQMFREEYPEYSHWVDQPFTLFAFTHYS
jgi:hypothetical protein